MQKVSSFRFIDVVYLLFLITASLDPTGYFTRLKDVLFVILAAYGLLFCLKNQYYISSYSRITMISFFLIPLWGIFIATRLGNFQEPEYAMGQVRSMLYIFIFFFVVTIRVDVLLKAIWINGIVMSVVTMILLVLSQISDVLWLIINEFAENSGSFLMALNRDFLGFKVNGLQFRASSLIIFAFVYNLYQYDGRLKTALSVLLYFTLFFAGSRTPMLVQTAILLVYLYDREVIGAFLTRLSAFVIFLAFSMLVLMLVTQEGEASNETKYENFGSYIDDIATDNHALWGAGLGSTFFANGRNEELAFTELSYMDILRIYGLPLGSYFIFLFVMPVLLLRRFFPQSLFLRRYCMGYMLFLVLSGTNPLLLGSIGLTGLTMMMAIANKTAYLDHQPDADGVIIDDYHLK